MGPVLESLANRKGDITNMEHRADTIIVEALIPMRGLIGFESDLVNMTRGMGILSHLFHEYGEDRGDILTRKTGSLISTETGESTAYALDMAQQRGKLLIGPGEQVFAGIVVGENARDQDFDQSMQDQEINQFPFFRRWQGRSTRTSHAPESRKGHRIHWAG